jgi:hypothetical protein
MGEFRGALEEGLGKGIGYALGGVFFLLLILLLGYSGIKLGGVSLPWASTQTVNTQKTT